MSQAERTTLKAATRWARWQTNATGEMHYVYRLDPVPRLGPGKLLPLRPRWIIHPEHLAMPRRGALEVTVWPHSDIREIDPTAPKDAS